ncbi:18462_t:CDS:2, partial [Racocetra fulgida]
IQEDSKEKFAEAQERLRLRAFTLRVAEEEGWTVAGKIPKPIPNEGNEFKDLLEVQEEVDFFGTKAVIKVGNYAREKENKQESSLAPTRVSDHVCTRTFGVRKTLEEPEMQILGSAHLAVRDLSQKAKALAKEAKFELDVDSPQEDGILAFIMWLDVIGVTFQILRVLQVGNKERGCED